MKFKYDKENEKLIVSEANRTEYFQLELWFNRKIKGYKFHPLVKIGAWDGNKSFFDGKVNLGLWRECLKACSEIEVKFDIENKSEFPLNREVTLDSVKEFCQYHFKEHKVKNKEGQWIPFMPYDYQIESAFKVLKNRYCMVEIATSGGKTLVISIVILYLLKHVKPDAKFLIITPSITLVTQFYDNILEYYYGQNKLEEPGFKPDDSVIRLQEIMSEKPRILDKTMDPNIYIGTYQSLEKWDKEWFKQFYGVITDESHTCKAPTLVSILTRTFTYAQYRFGVSGTFPKDDSCEILTIQSLLGPKVSQIEAHELVKMGKITPMQIKVMYLNYGDVELNNRLKAIRGPNNGREIWEFEKKYLHESEKRMEFVKKLIDKKCRGNTMVFFHTIEYGKKLLEEISKLDDLDVFYIDGEVSGKKRNIIFNQMKEKDRPKILVCSFGTVSTGVSINEIEYVIFADSFKSESLIIQSIGRSLRKSDGKFIATIYDLVDILDINACNNTFFRQYKEREDFYKKRKYPFDIIKINL